MTDRAQAITTSRLMRRANALGRDLTPAETAKIRASAQAEAAHEGTE